MSARAAVTSKAVSSTSTVMLRKVAHAESLTGLSPHPVAMRPPELERNATRSPANTQRRIVLRRATAFDSDQLSDIIPGGHIEHRLLEPGPFEARALHVETMMFRLDVLRYSTTVALQGELPAGRTCIAFALRMPDGIVAFGIPQSSSALMYFDSATELDIRLPTGAEWALLTFDTGVFEAELLRRHAGVQLRQAPEGRPLRVPGPYWRRVSACLKTIIGHATGLSGDPSDANTSDLDDVLLGATLAAYVTARLPHSLDHGALARRRRLVARTEEYLYAHLDDAIRMKRLCRDVGASARTLEYAFKGVYGIGVMDSLRTLRLNEVRKKLLRADIGEITVTTVAMDWGFWHLGEFAAGYKRLFGELPSQTLHNRQLEGRLAHGGAPRSEATASACDSVRFSSARAATGIHGRRTDRMSGTGVGHASAGAQS